MDDPASQAAKELCCVALGGARLPKAFVAEQSGVLIVELVLDSWAGPIVDVATTIPLPGHSALLRTLLVGRRLDGVAGALQILSAQLRGPLLKPTIAALANAVSNAENRVNT